jgi:D-arabinose 5-phosphate isomerase GutQ
MIWIWPPSPFPTDPVVFPSPSPSHTSFSTLHRHDKGDIWPFGLALVTSTIVQMVLGDTVIAAIMKARRLSRDKYASNHPADKIDKTLIFKVINHLEP